MTDTDLPGEAFGADGDAPPAPSPGAAPGPEANEADAVEQAAELDDRDTAPPAAVSSLAEANEADLAEQGRAVGFDEDDYR